MEEGKVCTTCKEWKPYSKFHKYKRMSDGYEIYCKECRKAYYKAKKLYIKKGTQEPSPLETKVINGIVTKGKVCTNCNEWKEVNQYHKFQRLAHGLEIYCKECRKEMTSQYFQTEKGKENSYKARMKRRSRLKKVKFKPHLRKYILERDNYTCQKCGIKVHDRRTGNWNTPDKAHIDHIVTLEDGGNSEPKNLWTLCRTCNLQKGSKSDKQLSFF